MLTFDAGDFGELETSRVPGGWRITKYAAELLGQLGLDAWTPGERELLHGPERIAELRDASGAVAVSANVRAASGERPFATDHIFTVGGLRVGVTGVTGTGALVAPRRADNLQELVSKWSVDDPLEALRPVVERLGKRSDVVVLLAHLSIDEARPIVEQLEDVDVVILGHNPSTGIAGERWGRAAVIRTGHKGQIAPMLSLMAGGDSVKVVDTVFRPLAPGDPFVADMQTQISLFEQDITSLREKASEETRRNRVVGGRTPEVESAGERSGPGDR